MTTSPSTRRHQAEERREQILEAAMRLFGMKGFDGASVREIAREVGVTEGLIYHYFESKEQLLATCWRERSWRPRMEAILDSAEGRPIDQVIADLLADFLSSLYANRASVVMCAVEMQHHPELAGFYMERIEENRNLIADLLRRRQALGEIRQEVDPEVVAAAMLGAPYSLLLLYHSLPPDRWQSVAERHIAGLTGLLAAGLSAAKQEQAPGEAPTETE